MVMVDLSREGLGVFAKWTKPAIRLTPLEWMVVKARISYGNNKPPTYKEIGKTLGLSRERVRQIEARGLSEILKCRLNTLLLPDEFVRELAEDGVVTLGQLLQFNGNEMEEFAHGCYRRKARRGIRTAMAMVEEMGLGWGLKVDSLPAAVRRRCEGAL